jgi:hypothetical protein
MATRKAGKRKMARKSAKSSRKSGAAKRGKSARKGASARKSTARKTAPRRSPARKNPSRGARVKRVAQEVVQQAQGAVVAGVETLKDLGENLMERVRTS